MSRKPRRNDYDSETDEEDKDFIDFVTNNQKGLKNNMKDFANHARNVWEMIPDMLSSMFGGLGNILTKIWMKLRSFILFQLTSDLNTLDLAKSLWDRCEMLHLITDPKNEEQTQFEAMILKIRNRCENHKLRTLTVKRFRAYVRKGTRQQFLTYYIENQDNDDFIWVRDQFSKEVNIKTSQNQNMTATPSKTVVIPRINTELDDFIQDTDLEQ